MSLLNPWAALWLVSLPILLTFYLFRPEPRKRLVTTFFLWKSSLQESQGGVYARRLRSNPLLWLQLLVLLLLSLYLLRPATSWRSTLPSGSKIAVIVDTSASMKAGGAFEQAVERALTAIDGLFGLSNLGSHPEVMLIVCDLEPRVLVPFTRDSRQLRQALHDLQASEVPDRLESLRPLVSSLISERKANVWLFSDHLPSELEIPGLQFSQCGIRPTSNVAMSAFSVELSTQEGASKPLLYARLDNFSDNAEQRLLRVETLQLTNPAKSEAVVFEQLVTLAAKESRTVSAALPTSRLSATQPTLFRASALAVPGAPPDGFAVDDVAYSCSPPYGGDRLTVSITPELRAGFLLRALMAHPSVEILDWEKLVADRSARPLDLLVSSRSFRLPPHPAVRTRILLTETAPVADAPVEVLQAVPGQSLVEGSGVQWERLRVQREASWPVAADEQVLLATQSGPALTLGGTAQGVPTLSWRFPLEHSSLPLSAALPILTGRFLSTYAQPTSSVLAGSWSSEERHPRPAGRDWSGDLRLLPRAGAALLGPEFLMATAGERELPRLGLSGLYQAELASGAQAWIAVNLLSARESALPWSDSDRVFTLNLDSEGVTGGATRKQYRELSGPLAMLALLLLLLEAALFLRRGRP